MMWEKPKLWECVPFVAMVTMEGCTVVLTIWAKTVLTNGMSPFVFVVYTHALSSLLLLPFSFFFHRNHRFSLLFSLITSKSFLFSCFLVYIQVRSSNYLFSFFGSFWFLQNWRATIHLKPLSVVLPFGINRVRMCVYI